MKLLIGIGNPGKAYKGTRHNVGFMVADALAEKAGAEFRNPRKDVAVTAVEAEGERLVLIKPLTYVNNSGMIFPFLRDRYPAVFASSDEDGAIEGLMVVCDDLNLPVGKIRIRRKGSSGGHNGLKSLIAAAGTDGFPRLRIGIGNPGPGADTAPYVLERFRSEELPAARESVERACQVVRCWAGQGIEECMNDFN